MCVALQHSWALHGVVSRHAHCAHPWRRIHMSSVTPLKVPSISSHSWLCKVDARATVLGNAHLISLMMLLAAAATAEAAKFSWHLPRVHNSFASN